MARATRHAEPRLAIKRRRRESVEITPELERLVCEMYREDQPVDKIQSGGGVMQGWREWVDRANADIEAIRRKGRSKKHHDREMAAFFKAAWFDENAERLIEGLLLCAEALEAWSDRCNELMAAGRKAIDEGIVSDQESLDHWYLENVIKTNAIAGVEKRVNEALEWLRGVGRD